MRLNAGDLNVRISLERDALTYEAGAELRAPAPYAEAWASMEYLNGSESWRAHAVTPGVNVRFVLRYRADVLVTDRVVVGEDRFEIKAVLPDRSTRESVTLECAG